MARCVLWSLVSRTAFSYSLRACFGILAVNMPDIYNTFPAQTVWTMVRHRASVQENEYIRGPWDIDSIIHVFEAVQANKNVVGTLRDVAEFEIAAWIRKCASIVLRAEMIQNNDDRSLQTG